VAFLFHYNQYKPNQRFLQASSFQPGGGFAVILAALAETPEEMAEWILTLK